MIVFSPIPAHYLPKMQQIERVSNPYPWPAESLQDGWQQFAHLGAFLQTELVAFVLYRQIVDEAEIIHLVCDKKHQGQGHAYSLLQALGQQLQANQVASVFLEVREDNHRARQLYENFGFVTVGHRPNYYGGRHDALIQRLDLT
ncbi:MAG: ribosomal-protein-alanine N-acetyltransferase [Gammaproteobacteria bacterium]|nr:MAG: ribosomal-protein-alanine N-acetyltransferase [Gammaproteobacteria bacterium]